MAYITKCNDKKCKLKEQCYRFTAENNEFRQSYFLESSRQGNKCSYFMKNNLL